MTAPSRLRPRDALRVAATGLRARPLRAVLSALGIAAGIAAMVAVVGIAASSRAEIDQQLRALGTNLLTVELGQTLRAGETAILPPESVDMVARIGLVTSVSAVGAVDDAFVYRTDRIDEAKTNGLTTLAARPTCSTLSAARLPPAGGWTTPWPHTPRWYWAQPPPNAWASPTPTVVSRSGSVVERAGEAGGGSPSWESWLRRR
jgi:putative ABC transport system permease protein